MFQSLMVIVLAINVPSSSSQLNLNQLIGENEFGGSFFPMIVAPPAFETITIKPQISRLTPVITTASTTTKLLTTTTTKKWITTTAKTVTTRKAVPEIPKTSALPVNSRITVRTTARTTTTLGLPDFSVFNSETPNGPVRIKPQTFPMIVGVPDHSTIIVPAPSPISFNGNENNPVIIEQPQPIPALPVEATVAVIRENEFIPKTGVAPPVFENETIDESSSGTSNGKMNGTISVRAFCGYPPYNERRSCVTQNYYEDNLSKCEVEGGVVAFGFFVVVLGILIISANVLLPLVVWKNPDMRTQYDYIKVSLAFSDMLMGILVIASVLPNVFRIRNLPLEQAVLYVDEDTNSPSAVVAGSLLTVSMQASVLHLMFLSIERFTAINWPLWHIRRKTSTIAATLVGLWAISLLSSFIPAAFPEYFEYKLQPALLIHMMTIRELPGENGEKYLGYQGPLYALFSLILPYVITVVFCILTGIVVYKKLTSGVRKFNKDHGDGTSRSTTTDTSNGHKSSGTVKAKQNPKTKLKPKISVFITIIIMIFAFTITLLPFTTIMTLFVVGQLNCSNYTIPYVIAFYIGLLNGLANPLIYTLRDRKFRLALRSLFCAKKISSMFSTKSTSNAGSNQSTQL